MATRLTNLKVFLEGYHGKKLSKLLTVGQRGFMESFVARTESLAPAEYDVAITKLHLDAPTKPEAWTAIEECLRAAAVTPKA